MAVARFVNLADFHFTGRSPRLRRDDFVQTLLSKAQFAVDTVKKYDCEAIVISGDMFDSPFVSIHLCDKLFEVLRGAGVPIACVAGNHDLDRSLSSLDRVPLGHYSRVGWLKLLTPDEPFELDDAAIFGLPYIYTPDSPTTDLTVPNPVPNKANVVTTHHLYMHKESPYFFEVEGVRKPLYTLVGDCVTNTDLVLLAHQHDPKDGYTKNGVYCWGPGSPVRLERTERHTKRYIGVVEVLPGQAPSCLRIEVPLKNGDEVFNLERIQEKEKYTEFMDKFVASLKELSVQSDNLPLLITRMAEQLNEDPMVVEETLKILAIAQNRCCENEGE